MSNGKPNKAHRSREYGQLASLGVAVPQASTVVEPECNALLPDGVSIIATRLMGSRKDSKDRLIGYLTNLQNSLDAFDIADLDAVGYACTGSTYLVGKEQDERAMQAASERFGYPVISAAYAVESALHYLCARKIAVLSPYPDWLAAQGRRHWASLGFIVADHADAPLDPNDSRSVYQIRSSVIEQQVKAMDLTGVDVILISGTGMPTLRAMPPLALDLGRPVISSNLCLTWALLRATVGEQQIPLPEAGEALIGGWSSRVRS